MPLGGPLHLAIVPSAKADQFDVYSVIGKARRLTSGDVDRVLARLQPEDTVIFDCRAEQRQAA